MAPNPPKTGRGVVASRDGTRIAYEVAGSGPPLILVMGALGSKDISFTKQYVRELANHFTVINYDRRGRGGSTDTKPYAIEREIEDLEALSRLRGPPYVFAVSSGAALALEAAAAGVPMAGLCAYEPPYMIGEQKNRPPPDYEARVTQLIAEGRRDDAVKYFMRVVGVPAFFVGLMRLFPFWKQLRANAHTLPYDAAIMRGFELPRKRFASIRVRTLAASGSKSPPSLRTAVDELAKTLPNVEHRILPKQNHGVKPKAITPVLVEFFLGGETARTPVVVGPLGA